jgi:hypothetical protein
MARSIPAEREVRARASRWAKAPFPQCPDMVGVDLHAICRPLCIESVSVKDCVWWLAPCAIAFAAIRIRPANTFRYSVGVALG